MIEPPGITVCCRGPSMSYEEIARFRAVALLPHVPHALRLADMYAMRMPILIPAEPLLHKFMWTHAGPYCGRSAINLVRSVDVGAPNRSTPPFSPFAFQGEESLDLPGRFLDDQRYWAQFTEWV